MRRRIEAMDDSWESAIAEALAFSNARGADLLVRLGEFDVWRGDLATMRGDEPRSPVDDGETEAREPSTPRRPNVLVLARAIEELEPACRELLSRIYALHHDRNAMSRPAHRLVGDCEKRLFAAYESLMRDVPATVTAIANRESSEQSPRRR